MLGVRREPEFQKTSFSRTCRFFSDFKISTLVALLLAVCGVRFHGNMKTHFRSVVTFYLHIVFQIPVQLNFQELRFGPAGQWRPLGGARPSLRAPSSEDFRRHLFDKENMFEKACNLDD